MRISPINNFYINRFQPKKQINFTSNPVEIEADKKYDFATTYNRRPHNFLTATDLVEIIKPIHSSLMPQKKQIIADVNSFQQVKESFTNIAKEMCDLELKLPKDIKEPTLEIVQDEENPNIKYECQRPYNPTKITTYDDNGNALFTKDLNGNIKKHPSGDDKNSYIYIPSKGYDRHGIIKRYNEQGEEDFSGFYYPRENVVSVVFNKNKSLSNLESVSFDKNDYYYINFFDYSVVNELRITKDSKQDMSCRTYKSTVGVSYNQDKKCYVLKSYMNNYFDETNPYIELYLSEDGKSIDKIRNYGRNYNYFEKQFENYDSGVVSLEEPIPLT